MILKVQTEQREANAKKRTYPPIRLMVRIVLPHSCGCGFEFKPRLASRDPRFSIMKLFHSNPFLFTQNTHTFIRHGAQQERYSMWWFGGMDSCVDWQGNDPKNKEGGRSR